MYMKKVKFVSSSEVFWSIFVRREPFRLSVCPYMFSHCLLLLQNHWDDFNQTWPKTTLGERGIVFLGFFFIWRVTLFSREYNLYLLILCFYCSKNPLLKNHLTRKAVYYVETSSDGVDLRSFISWSLWVVWVHDGCKVSTFYTGICWEILFYNIFLSKRLAKNAVTCVGCYRFKCVKIMIPVGWMGHKSEGSNI